MPGKLACRITSPLAQALPSMQFSTVIATGVDLGRLEHAAHELAGRACGQAQLLAASVQANVDAFDSFFAGRGERSPLTTQVASARQRGFPAAVPPAVLALLVLEAATGVLMGVQNLDAIEDYVELDVLASPASFVHLNGKTVSCAAGDIVVQDAGGIIASLFRGPDRRTAAGPASTNLLFYVFDAHPTIGAEHARACETVQSLLAPAAAWYECLAG